MEQEEEQHHLIDGGKGFRGFIRYDEVQLTHFLTPNHMFMFFICYFFIQRAHSNIGRFCLVWLQDGAKAYKIGSFIWVRTKF